ncbi:hypothetical protein E4U53_000269 [Claviceps sorghi]|nr:hypothetical protein E4U53_000269 [Claviceps sorghi]
MHRKYYATCSGTIRIPNTLEQAVSIQSHEIWDCDNVPVGGMCILKTPLDYTNKSRIARLAMTKSQVQVSGLAKPWGRTI